MLKQSVPIYQKLKTHIVGRIAAGDLRPGDRVPSEHELVRQFSTSRMTANRALRELADEGMLVRVAGVGTFVSEGHAHGDLLHLRHIAQEIAERNHTHTARVLAMEHILPSPTIAGLFGLPARRRLFHSIILHSDNGAPIQLEDRFVNPKVAPLYADQDFERQTTHAYLMRVAPLQRAEHVVQAVMPSARIRQLLKTTGNEPCLLIVRRTWSAGQMATYALLHHPGSRYDLTGLVTP